jgi:hypothetical protein
MTAYEAIEAIKEMVRHDCGGRRNEAKVAEVRRLLSHVPSNITIYAEGKRDDIQRWAEIYWSPRRHQRYGGTSQVAVSIFGACDVLRRNLPREETTSEFTPKA